MLHSSAYKFGACGSAFDFDAEDASEEDTSAQLNTKRALRQSEEKIAAMETKIDELTKMLQTVIDNQKVNQRS